jgi:hypothetical protein
MFATFAPDSLMSFDRELKPTTNEFDMMTNSIMAHEGKFSKGEKVQKQRANNTDLCPFLIALVISPQQIHSGWTSEEDKTHVEIFEPGRDEGNGGRRGRKINWADGKSCVTNKKIHLRRRHHCQFTRLFLVSKKDERGRGLVGTAGGRLDQWERFVKKKADLA